MGAWPRWRREQTRLSELRRPGPNKSSASPSLGSPGSPGLLRGAERQRTLRGRVELPSEESTGGVGPCGLDRVCGRRPWRVAAVPCGPAGCVATGRYPGTTQRLLGPAAEGAGPHNGGPDAERR
ncbi:hypothetical protein NDU88_000970 [Pleurodeles waltl]|uniref:Uncharacterized protein n=1 Tax=Pleurodeles waltl TaxID=8319 RepID=A0AAV7VAD9_PLEWA|nr:hypothetical protein NDU88_000970 [Pleurodeles waltl]